MYRKSLVALVASAALLFVLASGCKKETTEPDDPSIVYNNLQKSIDVVSGITGIDSLDLNSDGLGEAIITMVNIGGDTGYVLMNTFNQDIQFAVSKVAPVPVGALYEKGSTPPLSASSYYPTIYTPLKYSGYREGLLSGEGYLAFRFTTGTKYQYGWMRVSLNSGFTQFKILEYAYSVTPDKAIAVGAK
ncbi:MAG: hypothetical protein U0T84_07640 [Chitinophagales bacterium]